MTIKGESDTISLEEKLPCYYNFDDGLEVSDEQFSHLYGNIPAYNQKDKLFTKESTFLDIRRKFIGRVIYKYVKKQWLAGNDENTIAGSGMLRMLNGSPLRVTCYMPQITDDVLDGVVMMLN